jgi:membrane associated rhomboid family serine protease
MEKTKKDMHGKNYVVMGILVSLLVLIGVISTVMCFITKEMHWLNTEIFSVIIANSVLIRDNKENIKNPTLLRNAIILAAFVCAISLFNAFIGFAPRSVLILAVSIAFIPTIALVARNVVFYMKK